MILNKPSANLGIHAEDSEDHVAMLGVSGYIKRAEAVLSTRASALTEAPMQPEPTASAHILRQTLTYKFRLRDKHDAELNRQARAVNFVWNWGAI